MPLEDILEALTAFGRPVVNQFSGSATPGRMAAGTWGCEVGVATCSYEEAGKPSWYCTPCTGAPKGWSIAPRMTGRGATPAEAAAACLEECLALMETPAWPYMRPVSTKAAVAAERARKRG